MTGECVEWIADGKVIGKSHDVEIELKKKVSKNNGLWFELSINGLVFGKIRNIETIKSTGPNAPDQVRADFKPAPCFEDWMNDKRAMEFNSVIFLYNSAGDCEEVMFERRE